VDTFLKPSDPSSRRLTTILQAAVVLVAVGYVLLYAGLALVRLRYPFELEWMEGSIVEHVRRAAAGEALYARPSIDFVAYLYPPFYYYVSALAATVTGMGFLPLRAVSLTASLGVFAVIYALIKRDTASPYTALIAVGLFAATYRASGAWLDTARVDSLFLLLLLAGVYLVRFGTSYRSIAIAGALFALSALTKQTAVVIVPSVILYLALVDRRQGLVLAGAFAATFGGATLILEAVYGRWYNFYVFRLPAEIQNVGHVTLGFWTTDILRPMGLGFALAVGYVITTLARKHDRRTLFYPIFGTTLILTSWITRTHSGAFDNVLIPAYAGIAMLSALAIHAIARESGGALAGYAQAMCLAQMALLAYNPTAQLPVPGDRAIGEQLVRAISQVPGDVYVPWHGYLNGLAGKRGFAHSQAVADVFRGGDEQTQQRLREDITRAVREQRFQWIIVDRVVDDWLKPELESKYVRDHEALEQDGFFPLTGAPTRPTWVYVRR